jgi:hypothetical protein
MSRIFDITISQTLSKGTCVETDDYIIEYDMLDEEGPRPYYNTEDTDWYKVTKQNDILTPLELLEEFKKYLEYELTYNNLSEKEQVKFKGLLDNCKNWIDDSTIIIPE